MTSSPYVLNIRRVIALAAAFLIAYYVASFQNKYEDRFFPGVFIAGVPVGGMTEGEALDYFRPKADDLLENGLDFELIGKNGERKFNIPVEISGLTADNSVEYFTLGDWEGTVRRAFEFGHIGFWRSAAHQVSLVFSERNFDFPASVRDGAITSLLNRESKRIIKPSRPASFTFNGGVIGFVNEIEGEKINPKEIIKKINANLSVFDRSPVRIEANADLPEVTVGELSEFSEFADKLAKSTNLIFYYNGNRWRISGSRLVTWLTLRGEKNIGVDLVKLEDFLTKTVAPVIDNPPQNSRFEMRYGKLVEIVPGKSGNVVDVKKTAESVDQIVSIAQRSFAGSRNLLLALASATSEINSDFKGGNIEIPLEVVYAEPKISQKTIDQYEIRELVGMAVTNFAGSSSDRRKNIEVGVSKLNGMLIAPGEEFSAVESIGETTEEAGFVKEYVIKEDRSVKELGGGLCQLATTLFRLGLNAGLPITERVNHRYVVGYYGPGLDATIYGPKPDLRFVNDTENYILLQGRVDGNELIFELYGQRDGRTVEISEPVISDIIPAPETRYITTPDLKLGDFQCSEIPRKGLTAKVTYKVSYFDGKVNEQNFRSVYQPWSKVCLIGIR